MVLNEEKGRRKLGDHGLVLEEVQQVNLMREFRHLEGNKDHETDHLFRALV